MKDGERKSEEKGRVPLSERTSFSKFHGKQKPNWPYIPMTVSRHRGTVDPQT